MTSEQEDFALRSCHPLYREWHKEEDDEEEQTEDIGAQADDEYERWRDDQIREEQQCD